MFYRSDPALRKDSKEEKPPVPHPDAGKEHQWPSAIIPIRAESFCRHKIPGLDINTAVRKDHNYCWLLMILISWDNERRVNDSSVPGRFHQKLGASPCAERSCLTHFVCRSERRPSIFSGCNHVAFAGSLLSITKEGFKRQTLPEERAFNQALSLQHLWVYGEGPQWGKINP